MVTTNAWRVFVVCVALCMVAGAENVGSISARSVVTVANEKGGCGASTSGGVRVDKDRSGAAHVAVFMFDISPLAKQNLVPDLVVLRLTPNSKVAPQSLIGRLTATVVRDRWEASTINCTNLPQPVPKYEFPAKFISGIAGQELTLNLEGTVRQMLEDNSTTLAILVSADSAVSANLNFINLDQPQGPKLTYHLEERGEPEAELLPGEEEVIAGATYVARILIPKIVKNNTASVAGDELPQGALVVRVNEGNLNGKSIPVTVELGEQAESSRFFLYSATFTPKVAGTVRIGALLYDTPIRNSPRATNVIAGSASASKTTSDATVPGYFMSSGPQDVPRVGAETCFSVHTRDQFDNVAQVSSGLKLTVTANDKGTEIPSVQTEVAPGIQRFCFVPTVVDRLTLRLEIREEVCSGFPVEIDVAPGEAVPEKTRVSPFGEDVSFAGIVAGTPVSTIVRTVDLSGHPTRSITSLVRAEIVGPQNVQTTIAAVGNSPFSSQTWMNFTITRAGAYNVSLYYGSAFAQQVSVHILAAAAQANASIAAINMTGGFVGKVHAFSIEPRDRYGNHVPQPELSLEIVVAAVGETEVDPDISGDVTELTASWSAKAAGVYNVTVHQKNEAGGFDVVVGCPVIFTLAPGGMAPENSHVSPQKMPGTRAGEAQLVTFFEKDEFGNSRKTHDTHFNISARLVNEGTAKEVALVATNNDNGTFTIDAALWLRVVGSYKVIVFVNQEEHESVEIEVVSGPVSPDVSVVFQTSEEAPRSRHPVEFSLRFRDRFGNNVPASGQLESISAHAIVGGKAAPVVKLEEREGGVYTMTMTPLLALVHTLFVTYRGVPVARGPLTFEVGPGGANGPASLAMGEGLHTAIAGNMHHLTIQVHDREGNKITVGGASVVGHVERNPDAQSSDTDEFDLEVVDNKDGTYSAVYNITRTGDYSLFLRVANGDVRGSPFVLRVHPGAISAPSELDTAPVVDHDPVAGTAFSMLLNAYDAFGNPRGVGGDDVQVVFTAVDEDGVALPNRTAYFARVQDLKNGTYNVTGYLIKAGHYLINASSSGVQFAHFTEGRTFKVLPGPSSLEHAVVEGQALYDAVAGEENRVVLRLRDRFLNDVEGGGDNVTASLVPRAPSGGMPTSAHLPVSIDDEGNGTYIISYRLLIVGQYIVRVQLGAAVGGGWVDVINSPSVVSVVPNKPSTTHSYVTGGADNGAVVAGTPLHFVLHTQDEFNNTCTKGDAKVVVEWTPGEANRTYTMSLSNEHNGRYMIRVTPTRAGSFQLAIEINGDTLNVGRTVVVSPAKTSPRDSTFDAADLSIVEAGVAKSFAVHTVDRFGNPTNAKEGSLAIMVAGVTTNESVFGTFANGEATFTATRAGVANITVEFDGVALRNSPHQFSIIGSWTSPLHTAATGPGVRSGMAGFASGFLVTPLDQFGNVATKGPVNIEVVGPDGFLLPISYTASDVAYNVSYLPVQTGTYKIQVAVANSNIPGSPFAVLVAPGPTDPETSQAVGNGVAEVKAGYVNQFVIIARDKLGNLRRVGGDRVEVHCTTEDGFRRPITFDVKDPGDGMYRVSYLAPAVEGELVLSVLLNERFVGSKNYSVDVVFEPTANDCPKDCSEHGACNNRTGLCACFPGWTGPDCAAPHIPCGYNCSDRGRCDFATGLCLCNTGYSGAICECQGETCIVRKEATPTPTPLGPPLCKGDCSGHGKCVGRDTCNCDAGFWGLSCNQSTWYSLIQLESNHLILYELASGRMLGMQFLIDADDHVCAGIAPMPGVHPSLANTTFVQRPPHMTYVHIGDNKVLELDQVTGSVTQLSFKLSDLGKDRLGEPSEHPLEKLPALRMHELNYLGNNRLMVSTMQNSEVWVVNREEESLLVDDVTNHKWPASALKGRFAYIGTDTVARYTDKGKFELYAYDRANGEIANAPMETGALPFLEDFHTNNTMTLVALTSDTWLAFDPATGNYRAFWCPTDAALGFTGCTFLNQGNVAKDFSCTATVVTSECDDMSQLDCLQSARCGYCLGTNQGRCMAGTRTAPVNDKCGGEWVFSTMAFAHQYQYMGQNQVLEFESATGKYVVWSLDRTPRSQHCSVLSEASASGFLPQSLNNRLLFAGHDMLEFDEATGIFNFKECDQVATRSTGELRCSTWAAGSWPLFRFHRIAVIGQLPTILLDYNVRTGSYHVWSVASRSDYELGKPLVEEQPLGQGRLSLLKDADVTALDSNTIVVHQPATLSTFFLKLNSSMELELVGEPVVHEIEFVKFSNTEVVKQNTFTALGPRSLLMYGPKGYWKTLQCQPYPVEGDVFGGKAPLSCVEVSFGSPELFACSSRSSEELCLTDSRCGWCASTSSCHVGFSGGICDALVPNCPKADWHPSNALRDFDDTFVGTVSWSDEKLEDYDCSARNCSTCVSDHKCGWHSGVRQCVAGNTVGPHNSSLVTDKIESEWNYYFCQAPEACESRTSCSSCIAASFCGWCPGSNTCLTATAQRPLFDVCPEMKQNAPGLPPYNFYFDRCPAV